MKIYRSMTEIPPLEPTAVAVGNFDGIHLGHRDLILQMVHFAKQKGLTPAVFTFASHPKNFVAGKTVVKNLLPLEEKEALMEELGVEILFHIPFIEEICRTEPIPYIDQFLLGAFQAKEIFCGFNYNFGYKAGGTVKLLLQEGHKKNIGIHIVETFTMGDVVASSTHVRSLISAGKMEEASIFLGRRYGLVGEAIGQMTMKGPVPVVGRAADSCQKAEETHVVYRTQIPENMLTPAQGWYNTLCFVEDGSYEALTYVGKSLPQAGQRDWMETYFLPGQEPAAGSPLRVEFLQQCQAAAEK